MLTIEYIRPSVTEGYCGFWFSVSETFCLSLLLSFSSSLGRYYFLFAVTKQHTAIYMLKQGKSILWKSCLFLSVWLMSGGRFSDRFWTGNALINNCKQRGELRLTRRCWCSSMSLIHLLHQLPEESLCVSSENYLLSYQSAVSALFVLRYWRVCDADALLPVQHGVRQPARQPSLWLSARLHQSGRVLLHRYVCMHANTLLTQC